MQTIIANITEPEEKSIYFVRVKTMDDVEKLHRKIGIAGTYASELIKMQYATHPEWFVSIYETQSGELI